MVSQAARDGNFQKEVLPLSIGMGMGMGRGRGRSRGRGISSPRLLVGSDSGFQILVVIYILGHDMTLHSLR